MCCCRLPASKFCRRLTLISTPLKFSAHGVVVRAGSESWLCSCFHVARRYLLSPNMHLHSRCEMRASISPTITNTCPVALPGLLNGQTNIHQGEVCRRYLLQPWLLISHAAAPLTRDVNTLLNVCVLRRITCNIHHRLFTLSEASGVAICQRLTPESTVKPYVNNRSKKKISEGLNV